MKKYLVISALFLFITTLSAQDSFRVRELPDSVKYLSMVFQANGLLLNTINYAKSLGKTVEEVATFTGDQFKTSWNTAAGFPGFVRTTLNICGYIYPEGDLKILEQSDKMVKFQLKSLYPDLVKAGQVFNVTYQEYLTFTRILFERIADSMESRFTVTESGDGWIATITRK